MTDYTTTPGSRAAWPIQPTAAAMLATACDALGIEMSATVHVLTDDERGKLDSLVAALDEHVGTLVGNTAQAVGNVEDAAKELKDFIEERRAAGGVLVQPLLMAQDAVHYAYSELRDYAEMLGSEPGELSRELREWFQRTADATENT